MSHRDKTRSLGRDRQPPTRHGEKTAMPKSALLTVVENLHRLAQAEALRDKGGKQHDMFAHLTQEEFAATQHRMDQPALF